MQSFHKVFLGGLAQLVAGNAIFAKVFVFNARRLTKRWTCRLIVSVTALAAATAAPDTWRRSA